MLAASDSAWQVVGLAGLLIGLPQGVLPALLLVPLGLFALAFIGRAMLRVGPGLHRALGLDRLAARRGRAALWSIAWVLLALGIASMIALAPDRADGDARPLCTSERLVLDAGRMLARMMGHGRVPAGADCRSVERPPLGPLLPALLACAAVLSLLSAHERHWQREDERRDEARRAAFVRAATQAATSPARHSPADDIGGPAAVPANAPPALSARSATLMAKRRAASARPRTDWLRPLRRWPVLGALLLCYAAGWTVTLAGSDLAERLAAQLAPEALSQARPGWAVPGLWLSACAGLAIGIAGWLRRRDDD